MLFSLTTFGLVLRGVFLFISIKDRSAQAEKIQNVFGTQNKKKKCFPRSDIKRHLKCLVTLSYCNVFLRLGASQKCVKHVLTFAINVGHTYG